MPSRRQHGARHSGLEAKKSGIPKRGPTPPMWSEQNRSWTPGEFARRSSVTSLASHGSSRAELTRTLAGQRSWDGLLTLAPKGSTATILGSHILEAGSFSQQTFFKPSRLQAFARMGQSITGDDRNMASQLADRNMTSQSSSKNIRSSPNLRATSMNFSEAQKRRDSSAQNRLQLVSRGVLRKAARLLPNESLLGNTYFYKQHDDLFADPGSGSWSGQAALDCADNLSVPPRPLIRDLELRTITDPEKMSKRDQI